MYPTLQIEERVKAKVKEPLSVAHGFIHLKRTAIGAKWFAKLLKASKEEQEKAYLSGLVHDIYRPPSSKAHDETLGEDYKQAKKILQEFDLNKETIEGIALPIKQHRSLSAEKNLICQSVFLADKILENMGAMIVFRRNMYVGENPKYVGVPLEESIKRQYKRRLKMYNPRDFPKKFQKLAEYQYKWPVNYLKAFRKKEEWAVALAEYCYWKGKRKKEFGWAVAEFKPSFEKDKIYRNEALQYLKGYKFNFFESLIK